VPDGGTLDAERGHRGSTTSSRSLTSTPALRVFGARHADCDPRFRSPASATPSPGRGIQLNDITSSLARSASGRPQAVLRVFARPLQPVRRADQRWRRHHDGARPPLRRRSMLCSPTARPRFGALQDSAASRRQSMSCPGTEASATNDLKRVAPQRSRSRRRLAPSAAAPRPHCCRPRRTRLDAIVNGATPRLFGTSRRSASDLEGATRGPSRRFAPRSRPPSGCSRASGPNDLATVRCLWTQRARGNPARPSRRPSSRATSQGLWLHNYAAGPQRGATAARSVASDDAAVRPQRVDAGPATHPRRTCTSTITRSSSFQSVPGGQRGLFPARS